MRLYIASYILIYYDTILYHLLFIFIRYYIVYLFLLYVFFIRPLFNLSLKVSYWNKFKREICRQATWHFPQFTLDAITGQVYCILARRDERELGEFCSWSFGIELLRGKRNATGKCAEGRGGDIAANLERLRKYSAFELLVVPIHGKRETWDIRLNCKRTETWKIETT